MLLSTATRNACRQELLEAGASTKLRNKDGHTALEVAESQGYPAKAKLLRQRPAKRSGAASPKAPIAARGLRCGGGSRRTRRAELLADEGAKQAPTEG